MKLLDFWLSEMQPAIEVFLVEKAKIQSIVAPVTAGIKYCSMLAKATKWTVPNDDSIVKSLIIHIKIDTVKRKLRDSGTNKLILEDLYRFGTSEGQSL